MADSRGNAKKVFSISKKYRDQVNKILSKQENQAEFICQAIIEKNERSKKGKKIEMTQDEFELKIKEVVIQTLAGKTDILNEQKPVIQNSSEPQSLNFSDNKNNSTSSQEHAKSVIQGW